MKLTSSVFDNNGAVPKQYTCLGAGISPPLAIDDAPNGTRSLALTVDDPDAPGGTFDHWIVWNISPALREIPENWELDRHVNVGTNGFGNLTYGGPCPPSGTHHYHFKAYALDDTIKLADGATKDDLQLAMADHILGRAQLIGTFTK